MKKLGNNYMELLKLSLIALAALGSFALSSCNQASSPVLNPTSNPAQVKLEHLRSITDKEYFDEYLFIGMSPANREMMYEQPNLDVHTLHLMAEATSEREVSLTTPAVTEATPFTETITPTTPAHWADATPPLLEKNNKPSEYMLRRPSAAPQVQAGGYPQALYDAIEAVHNARETLVGDLENDQGQHVRGMWDAAPMDFDKVLKDEKIYNAAVRVFNHQMGVD